MHVIIFSGSVIYATSPYVLPGDLPLKYNLNSQIPNFMIAPNCQHLSEGFICFALLGWVCVRAQVCAGASVSARLD